MTLLLVFPVHFCQILIVVLFYVAGFPRKQTGKNLYFLIFCSCVGNPVATHTHTHTLQCSRWGRFYSAWCAATQKSSEFGPNIPSPLPHLTHVHTHIHTQCQGQRGPSSEGGPSLPFTVNRTVAFHSWGRYMQREPYIASRGSSWSLAL